MCLEEDGPRREGRLESYHSPYSSDLQTMDWASSKGSTSATTKVTKEYLEELLHSLACEGSDAKIRAAKEIRMRTKKSSKARAYLAASGAIFPLVTLLSSSDFEAKEAALLALLNLAVGNERNKVKIVKAGALPLLVDILTSEDTSLRESAAAAVLTLSVCPVNKSVIGASGVIPPLVEILISGSSQGKLDAVMALCNLSTCTENLQLILMAGALSPLIKILKEFKKNKFAEKTSALLESILTVDEARIAIVQEEAAILALVETVEDGSPQSREHAVGALLNLCRAKQDYRQALLREGVIPGVLELTVQGTPKAQQKAKTLLQVLRDSSACPEDYSSPDVIESIVCDIAAHVDCLEQGSTTARQMLAEMVKLSMERSMKQLQRRALLIPSNQTSG
eukprot:TRINITY_DN22800_c0_g1_i1.p1 TRINITY_DN22800_c0_g1~~TRINITY_DN22800_c0_g1_i1.p1  ORF type:complete len:395 (-),score=94.64 TRINITY_DN22800_c0_g1_i1:341-1525(-)